MPVFAQCLKERILLGEKKPEGRTKSIDIVERSVISPLPESMHAGDLQQQTGGL